jgi:LmbE family N-acetylglucosaminyl deacetylase
VINKHLLHDKVFKSVAIIVAHPDDETLWAGGEILNNPLW